MSGIYVSEREKACVVLKMTVNGKRVTLDVDPERSLLDILRRDLQLTGAKNGCDVGICGTCSVIIDGNLKKSCIVEAAKAQGAEITTVEGIGSSESLAPIQKAFINNTASQCGMCTSGFIVACHHYLQKNPKPMDRDAIRTVLRKDLCRCTGYEQIVDAVQEAAGLGSAEEFLSRTHIVGSQGVSARPVVGHSLPQYGVTKKVTGQIRYADDYPDLEGMVHLAAVRSPHPHARLMSIDAGPAMKTPGVVRVLTAEDIPGGDNYVGMLIRDQRVIVPTGETVKSIGDVVALVAAESEEIARNAARSVRVNYDILAGVFDPREALKPDAPVVHPELTALVDSKRPNLIHHQHIHKGVETRDEIDRTFSEASERGLTVVEGEYRADSQDHAPLEPEAAFTVWNDQDERVEVYAPVQHVFFARRNIREAVGIHSSQVRVVGTPCGGAYGKREDPYAHPQVALATWVLRRPCRMLWTREETMQYTQKRHAMQHRYRAAVHPDGKIEAFQAEILLDGGAYRSWRKEITTKSAVMASGPYEIPNVWIDTYGVYTNNPLCGACRGFGTANTLFGTEVFWGKVARTLGIDPYALRHKNTFRKGSLTSTRHRLQLGVRNLECLEAAHRVFGWDRPLLKRRDGDWLYGRGMATIWYGNGFGRGIRDEGHPIIEIRSDGTVTIHASTVDYGQGSNTVFAQVTADILGIPVEAIELHTADSDSTPNCGSTVASRVTVVVGKAVDKTARALRTEFFRVAAPLLSAQAEELESHHGKIWVRDNPSASITFKEVASHLSEPLICQVPKLNQEFTTPLDLETGQGKAYWPYVFATHMCTVAVNVKNAKVKILEYTAAHDIGKVINPQAARGQVIGGVAMGVGYALYEDLKLQNGRVRSDNFDTYNLPRSSDLPDMKVVFVEDPELDGRPDFGPNGAKGIGEPPTIAPAPCIVNAIQDALNPFGVELTRIPLTRERLRVILKEADIAAKA